MKPAGKSPPCIGHRRFEDCYWQPWLGLLLSTFNFHLSTEGGPDLRQGADSTPRRVRAAFDGGQRNARPTTKHSVTARDDRSRLVSKDDEFFLELEVVESDPEGGVEFLAFGDKAVVHQEA